MSSHKSKDKLDQVVARAHRERSAREDDYRERALKMYPWICGRCAREFNRDNLRELTVHHRDHDHDNNPADGTNWELLCVYCHDNEHSRYLDQEWYSTGAPDDEQQPPAIDKPFANLNDLLQKKK